MTGEGLEPSTNGLTFRTEFDVTLLIRITLRLGAFGRVAPAVAPPSWAVRSSVPVAASNPVLSPWIARLGSIEAAFSMSTARGLVYRPVISSLEWRIIR